MKHHQDINSEYGFSIIELLIVLVIVVLVGGVGWLVYRHHKAHTAGSSTAATAQNKNNAAGAGSSRTQPYWMISPGHLKDLIKAGLGQSQVNYFFDNSRTILNLGANGINATYSQIASAHSKYPNASINLLFNSFGTNVLTGEVGIQGYLSNDPNLNNITYIQYDPEGSGNGTPASETSALESNNMSYAQQAAKLIHSKRLKFIFTPSTDAGMSSSEAGPNKYCSWISQKRGVWAKTSGADIYSIQTQQIEGLTSPGLVCPASAYPSFDSFTQAAVTQAQNANPHIPIDIGIGINPHSPATAITTQDIMNAYNEGQQLGVAGYWNNVEVNTGADVPAGVYVAFFNKLYTDLSSR